MTPVPFTQRMASTGWEQVILDATQQVFVWAWFKPVPAPNSIILQLPAALWQRPAALCCLTIRQLVAATGLESLAGWTYGGQFVAADQNSFAWLDAGLPPPTGADPQLILWSQAVLPAAMPAQPSLAAGAMDLLPGESPESLLDMIDYSWRSVLYLEADIERARMQLDGSMSRLNSLDRDLSFEEAQAADNLDKKDWVDARRFLRSAAHSLSRSIKEIHTGTLSAAGQRNRFEAMYQQYVKPRIPFPGMRQAAVDFEMHFKTARNILQAAQSVLSKGTQDAERRANSVLQRIAGKIGRNRSNARNRNK
ncbi:MAG: hypothetical protein U0872_04415 [Planctomycetaceae bacterium]